MGSTIEHWRPPNNKHPDRRIAQKKSVFENFDFFEFEDGPVAHTLGTRVPRT